MPTLASGSGVGRQVDGKRVMGKQPLAGKTVGVAGGETADAAEAGNKGGGVGGGVVEARDDHTSTPRLPLFPSTTLPAPPLPLPVCNVCNNKGGCGGGEGE